MTSSTRAAAQRTCGALQLAALDGRHADIAVILAGLGEATLRAVAAEMTQVWLEAMIDLGYHGPELRAAVAADAVAGALRSNG